VPGVGVLEQGTKTGKFGKHHHLHPWIKVHGQLKAVAHGFEIRAVGEMHLNSSNGEGDHEDSIIADGKFTP
jgi:hypothetical protein